MVARQAVGPTARQYCATWRRPANGRRPRPDASRGQRPVDDRAPVGAPRWSTATTPRGPPVPAGDALALEGGGEPTPGTAHPMPTVRAGEATRRRPVPRAAAGARYDHDGPMTALSSFEHRLVVVTSPEGRQVLTSLARGRERGHRLVCGACAGVLALDRAPMPRPAAVMRCVPCGSLNDLGRGQPDPA